MTQIVTNSPNIPGKVAYLPTMARASAIAVGAAFAVNHSNIPVLKQTIGNYHKVMYGLFQKLGGKNMKDESLLNAGFSTSIDFVTAGLACVVLGRMGLGEQAHKIGENIKRAFGGQRNPAG